MGVQEWMEKSEVVEARARVARAVQSLWLNETRRRSGFFEVNLEGKGRKTYE